ncbi:uncharacterized protein LOC122300183 [Carya illinoinensis]|uniref:Uncharacterized protein n=1 Tax=Carya illinoinensis TaxID=32201 RepID=A0A8T1RAK1_CARIL|nr:uncharacterized protein LOC122300183 [Carya illinoinensis]KAG6663927.1 hypothetical protein CIPAW_02G056000 [Carya illinoinensis]
MADSPCESKSRVSSTIGFHHNPEDETLESQTQSTTAGILNQDEEWVKLNVSNKKNKKSQVLLEGYVEPADEDDLTRTKSLTDDDLDELKGCLDLGFGFSYDEIPELCNTLPALELCYSMSQKFMDEQQKLPENADAAARDSFSSVASPIANWRISSPGDHPEDVKARLKFWAQAVACTVKLCS